MYKLAKKTETQVLKDIFPIEAWKLIITFKKIKKILPNALSYLVQHKGAAISSGQGLKI